MASVESRPPLTGNRARRDGLWIVVPAYNEATRLAATLEDLGRCDAQIVVIDDGSLDATAAVATEHRVHLLQHLFNCGQGAALATGMRFALARGARFIVTFDADGQHTVDDIEALIAPLYAGECDVTLGSRFLGSTTGIPLSRYVVLRLGVWFTRVFCRIRVTDTHNGLRAFTANAASRVRITQNRMAHASEILDQIRLQNLRYQEVPVSIHYTAAALDKGQSSWNALRIAGEYLLGRVLR